MHQIKCLGGVYYIDHDLDMKNIDESSSIGPETKIWNGAKIYSGAKIGSHCVIGAGVHIENDVSVGDYCKVQRGVTLYRGVDADDYVFFGPNATTTNDRNPRAFGEWKLSKSKFEIGSSIGANATIVAGTKIGALALVGAGSVVVRDIEPCSLYVGNPAKRIGWVDVAGNVISHDDIMPEGLMQVISDPRGAIEKYLESNK